MKPFFVLVFALILGTLGAQTKELVVGSDFDYIPWEFMTQGKPDGINIKIIEKIAAKMGLKIRYEKNPFKRNLVLLESGALDMVGGLEPTADRLPNMAFLQPEFQPTVKIFVMKKGAPVQVAKYEDLKKYTIGVRLGTKQFDTFDTDASLKKISVEGDEALFTMLLAGRFDLLVGSYTSILTTAKKMGILDKIDLAAYRVDLGRSGTFALSKKSSFLPRLKEFETHLQAMLKSGEIDQIIKSALNF